MYLNYQTICCRVTITIGPYTKMPVKAIRVLLRAWSRELRSDPMFSKAANSQP